MMYRDPYMNDWENTIEDARRKENEPFQLTAPEGEDSDEDSLGDQTTNDSTEIEIELVGDVMGQLDNGPVRFENLPPGSGNFEKRWI